ncbi:MAG: hydrolase 1, exosortase A system-associated [Sphingomonadales bacterium]|nr:hydrolase 1, exosortase A system-associated [Sphingomonadales bacterium]
MNRRDFLAIPCEGATLMATLDLPAGGAARSGLLVVTGGNEIRSGAWNGHALLAARLSAQGHAVLRFDRRGIGDSDGANAGFRGSAADIAAALAAFRAEVPGLRRVVGWGNCDAASALMLGAGCDCDALVLSNPWTYAHDDDAGGADEPAPAPLTATELRAHYRARLLNPAALRRLLTGGVPLGKLARSLVGLFRKPPPPGTLAQDMAAGLARFDGPVQLLVAERDRTGQAFLAAWDRDDARIARCPDATHSFVEAHAQQWLEARLLAALAG